MSKTSAKLGFSINIGITGTAPEKLKKLATKVRPALRGEFTDIMNDIWRDATKAAPIRTGNLRRTIGPPVIEDTVSGVKGSLGVRAVYGKAIEFGLPARTIRPVKKKALRFIGSDGNVRFAKKVNLPATDPQPYMQPAYDKHQGQARARIKAIILQTANAL